MSICPEGEYRNSLSEEEFWNYVCRSLGPEEPPDSLTEDEIDYIRENGGDIPQPCPVCRSIIACSYDSEGRPMIHVVEDSESEDDS